MWPDSAEGQQPAVEILYVLALPDWKPNEVTPFQGFAPGLPWFVPLMESITHCPADILEYSMDQDDRLARRRTGLGSWLWTPVNVSTLLAKRKPTTEYPFMVVFSADKPTAKAVAAWRQRLRLPPLHVSNVQVGGALNLGDFTTERLRQYLLTTTKRVAKLMNLDLEEHFRALNSWQPIVLSPSSIRFHSHNVTKPNEMVLIGAGEEAAGDPDGHLNVSPPEDYIRGITESAEAVIRLWKRTEGRPAYVFSPPRPDLFLVAPAMFRGIAKRLERKLENPAISGALRALDRQRDYTMAVNLEENGSIKLARCSPFAALK